MKTEAEIQRAHDMLVGVILGETPVTPSEEVRRGLSGAAAVLCWILEHDHSPAFGLMLKDLEDALADEGAILTFAPPPSSERRCRECCCTEDNWLACIIKTGEPCHWVEQDLCSACAAEMEANVITMAKQKDPP